MFMNWTPFDTAYNPEQLDPEHDVGARGYHNPLISPPNNQELAGIDELNSLCAL